MTEPIEYKELEVNKKMIDISLAILSVGLCFYNAYLIKIGSKMDFIAGLISFVAALTILFK